ncbi:MAG: TlpA family protein disulfide reductase [Nitrospirae bacterium]|nr:MAG: TlpA family protein disulfide reductase [Nitrospirota bacterium]
MCSCPGMMDNEDSLNKGRVMGKTMRAPQWVITNTIPLTLRRTAAYDACRRVWSGFRVFGRMRPWYVVGFAGVVMLMWLGCEARTHETGAKDKAEDGVVEQSQAIRRGPPQPGHPAPDFTLINQEGQWMSLSDFQGKVVLLNFWATWCTPCRIEMPSMEQVYRVFKEKGFEILAISSDPQGNVVTRPFREANGLTFPILHDSDFRVSTMYGVRTLPMSFLIDRTGTVRHKVFGARNWNSPEAKALLQSLLNGS